MRAVRRLGATIVACALIAGRASPAPGETAGAPGRGEYVFQTAGGCSCHTDRDHGGAPLAGGRAIKSPYGTFYSTNITPDRATGIGAWSEEDFALAMREGVAPDGSSYFPVFPYTSFTRMSDEDLRDLWTYLRAQPAVRQADRPHEIRAMLGSRILLPLWKWLCFEGGRFSPDLQRSEQWNRGAYLATGPGHCSECHTPRGRLSGPRRELYLAGSEQGPEGELAPNITPDPQTGIGRWKVPDVVWLLQTGFAPDGDSVQGLMAEVIEQGYQHLGPDDLEAIAVYLRDLPPIRHEVKKKQR